MVCISQFSVEKKYCFLRQKQIHHEKFMQMMTMVVKNPQPPLENSDVVMLFLSLCVNTRCLAKNNNIYWHLGTECGHSQLKLNVYQLTITKTYLILLSSKAIVTVTSLFVYYSRLCLLFKKGRLHGPSMFAVKAKIYGVLYNQASSIAFDETSSYWSALKSS